MKPAMPPRLSASKFTHANGAERNRVFLWKNHDTFPHLRPVEGWKIVGWGKAPWPGSTDGFAVMMEKVTPAVPHRSFGKSEDEIAEGERIWIHGNPEWVPGHPGYERRAARQLKRQTFAKRQS